MKQLGRKHRFALLPSQQRETPKAENQEMNRRSFLGQTSTAVAGAALIGTEMANAKTKNTMTGAADRIRLGLIGVKGMGWGNLQAALKLPNIEVTALCDVDATELQKRAAELAKDGKKPALYDDFRKLLEDKNVDAVIIGTPDHWHTIMTMYALEAGKHVYVEKPLANTISECQYLIKAVPAYGKVVQVGQQQRSASHWADAIAYYQSGKMGRVRQVKCWSYADWKTALPKQPDGVAPAGVNYDMWLGPAPLHAFNPLRFHFTFRWFWDYAGGLMTDWGVHLIDIAMMAMKVEKPISVIASGGKLAFPTDGMETPDTMVAIYDYGDFILNWEHTIGIGRGPYGKTHGVALIGENGTLLMDRGGWEILPEMGGDKAKPSYKTEMMPLQKAGGDGRVEHFDNFFSAIRTGSKVICPIADGANVAMVAHMGNIALRTGQKVYWDEAKGIFTNNGKANELAKHNYRGDWKLPALKK